MFAKHTFLTAAATLTLALALGAVPASALGGDDPIEGIDIIIKGLPDSRPIAPVSVGDDEKESAELKRKPKKIWILPDPKLQKSSN
ncbi:hypothetical protein [Shimia sagamensis]|uniref:Uncharacterized protein n=1 Tax=Shimia sagamensis TaxID=1566352 RepID=A0ABY1NPA6_9RHOB|nr:hypothetical protein [Shimia sagamensis]SMP13808.1 hypothetical protein SAMN06265373_102589 [Shimia sagamensis]